MAFGAPFPGGNLRITNIASPTVYSGGFVSSVAFSNVAIGPASSSRYLVIAAGTEDQNGTTGSLALTVNGISATKIVAVAGGAVTVEMASSIWFINVPAGTTANIVVSCGAQIAHTGITVYSLDGLTNISGADGTGTGSTSTSVTVQSNGVVFGASTQQGSTGSVTWTGLTVDQINIPNNITDSEAHAAQLAAQTLSVSVSWAGGVRGFSVATASFH